MNDLVTQLETALADVQAALATAQAAPVTTDPNDSLVAGLVGVFTSAGYTVTAPGTTPELPEGPVEDATDTSES